MPITMGAFVASPLHQGVTDSLIVPVMASGEALATVFAQTSNGSWTLVTACGDPAIGQLRETIEAVKPDSIPVDHVIFRLVSGTQLTQLDPNAGEVPQELIERVQTALPGLVEPPSVEVSWEDLAPDRRSVPDAPQDIQRKYELLVGAIRVPKLWSDSVHAGSICSRTESAWGACVSLDFEWGVVDNEYLPLDIFTLPGETIELHLLDATANLDGPKRLLGTVPLSGRQPTDSEAQIAIDILTESGPEAALRNGGDVRIEVTHN